MRRFSRQRLQIVVIHALYALLAAILRVDELDRRRNDRVPWYIDPNRRNTHLARLRSAPPGRMKQILRVTPTQFDQLLALLRLEAFPSASADVQLAIFLSFVGAGEIYSSICNKLECNRSIVSQSVHRVLEAILVKARSFMPTLLEPEEPAKLRHNPKFWPFFKGCIGAIDGSLIPIAIRGVGEDQRHVWRCRKGFFAQNVMVAVDFNMSFRFVFAGFEGSGHDSSVLQKAREAGFTTPNGCFWLVDAGYSGSDPLLLKPYRRVRYHLHEWSLSGRRPVNEKELFNLRHASLRNVVERSLGVLKARFRLLQAERRGLSMADQIRLTYACVYLHNFLNASGDDPEAEATVLDDRALRDCEEDSSAFDAPEGNKKRDKVAKDMWESYQMMLESL